MLAAKGDIRQQFAPARSVTTNIPPQPHQYGAFNLTASKDIPQFQ
jgi:hypothetical protein